MIWFVQGKSILVYTSPFLFISNTINFNLSHFSFYIAQLRVLLVPFKNVLKTFSRSVLPRSLGPSF